jgi:hypothetical protein
VQDAMMFTDILYDIFDDKVPSNQHVGVKHLLELIEAVHISLNFKHSFLSIFE